MTISFSSKHEQFLAMRAMRNEVLSTNIANADTPNYKARDYDFADAMRKVGQQQEALPLKQTSALHKNSWNTNDYGSRLMYRVPMQPTLDGNTVETDVEQAAFAENAIKYRASLRFLDGHFKGLRYAIKGGE
ncbi:MAG: flagellar basal body rod protein FlgB [Woeseiaceae bacterium]|nr:flagellar basal body rod protein FlgB [Woeseiaceae bacterium]